MTLFKKYLDKSWISSKLELRKSSIHGTGIFTKKRIKKGEVTIIWGGIVFTDQDVANGRVKEHTGVGIGEGLYLGAAENQDSSADDYMNHSCNPNIWMKDEVTLIASRNIEKDEELTADYVIWLNNEEYVMKNICYCGSPTCRNKITGKDWRSIELQLKYKNHFSPFINERIRRLKK